MKKSTNETYWKQSYVRRHLNHLWDLALLIFMIGIVGAGSSVHAQYIGSSEIQIDKKSLNLTEHWTGKFMMVR